VNQLNDGEQSSAEVGEERAQTKENIVQSHMRPTQSGERVSQGLSGVRQAARDRKQERLAALLHHLSVGLLRDSFYALRRPASPGVDGVRWKEYETGLEDRLVDLHGRCTLERIGHNPHEESTFRRPMDGNVHWES
jgi:RNA-directed DNA polymerase